MPTNTTTTPATNTNTTPLSAMTGEEVASILVGLIRQNDGVLIQTKLENALRSTGYAAIANDMAQGKQALYTLLQSKGVTIQGNESISECCALLNAACLTLGQCELAEGVTSIDLGNMLNSSNHNDAFSKIASEEVVTATPAIGVTGRNIREIYLPECIDGYVLFDGTTMSAHRIYVPKYLGKLYDVGPSPVGFLTTYTGSPIYDIRHVEGTRGVSALGRQTSMNYLYDYKPVPGITVSISFVGWRPTYALSSAMQSICTPDEWDDENQPTFENNLQKFLWYFEYHFIPSFGTVTTSPVLSLYTTVYNAINSANSIAQPTKTLKQLLTDKGWEVASVS